MKTSRKSSTKLVTKTFIYIFLLISVLAIGLVMLHTLLPSPQVSGDSISIDFSQPIGTLKMKYGANENDNWEDFSLFDLPVERHKEINTQIIRVWVNSPWWRSSTVPLENDGSLDYTNLTVFINAALQTGATPLLVFAHAPDMLSDGGKGIESNPPVSNIEFANYVKTTVQYFADACSQNLLSQPCDVNQWYFEIWNEPWQDVWWENNRYISLYNEAYLSVKSVAPKAKVGGFVLNYLKDDEITRLGRFLRVVKTDFITIHHYGNTYQESASDKDILSSTKYTYHDSMIQLASFVHSISPTTLILNDEYNFNYLASYMPHLDEQQIVPWYASALMWQITSQSIDAELFYSGTSNFEKKGFGMWGPASTGFAPWPVFEMKKQFVKYNTFGSTIFMVSQGVHTEALAAKNINGIFITLVNKDKHKTSIFLYLDAQVLQTLPDGKLYHVNDGHFIIPMQGYKVEFLKKTG